MVFLSVHSVLEKLKRAWKVNQIKKALYIQAQSWKQSNMLFATKLYQEAYNIQANDRQ